MLNVYSEEWLTCAYLRLSKEDRALSYGKKTESDSISNQKQLILDFAEKRPEIKIVSIRIDDGYTGSNYDRPAFQLMLEDIKAGRINCVIVKDLSRFGREYIDSGKYIDRLFPFYGVRLIAINDGIDTITNDPANEFGITIRNLFNDNYCRDISIKTRSSLKVKRKNGEYTGAFAPYGYRRSDTEHNRLLVDEYAASIVQDIFKWKLAGMSLDGIAKELNTQGVLSPLEYKQSQGFRYASGFKTKQHAAWTPVTVRRILTNQLYVGTLIQGIRTTPNHKVMAIKINRLEDCCVVEKNHEALISKKNYDLVQQLLLLDTRTPPNGTYVSPLAGMVECGDCKSPMVRKTSTVGNRKYCYYTCKNHKENHACSSHRIKKEELEQTVLATLQKHISTILNMDDFLDTIGRIPFRQVHIKKAEERIQRAKESGARYGRLKALLYEDMKEGIVSKEDYQEISRQYADKVREAAQAESQARKELEQYIHNVSDQQIWMQDFLKYRNLTELTRNAVVELIRKIQIFEGKRIEIEFAHAQDYQELMEHIKGLSESQRKGEA